MTKEERKGQRNCGEIIPWCEDCGELLDTDKVFEWGVSIHEWVEFTCTECLSTTELQLEHCWFSRRNITDKKGS